MGDTPGRRGLKAALEAESREWLVRCPACGFERSVAEMGGTRYKAYGTKKNFLRCPQCRGFGWHTIYRSNAGVRLAPLRPSRPLWWHIGVFGRATRRGRRHLEDHCGSVSGERVGYRLIDAG